jgi:uncharacterized C2H2 Zn-finger protein
MKEKENYYKCPECGATFDTIEEREAHCFEKHEYLFEEVEIKSEQLAQAEEPKEAMKKIREAVKKKLLSEALPSTIEQWARHPEQLEARIDDELVILSLKHPMLGMAERTLLHKMLQARGESMEKYQTESKEEEPELEYPYYYYYPYSRKYPKYKYYYPYGKYYEQVTDARCPVCGKEFPDFQSFKVHWSREHQMTYGELPYGTYKPERLAKEQEDRQRQENLMILKALLRNKLE